MIKDKLIDGKKIVSRFRGKLVKMIRNAGSKYDDYSISSKIRQILLHWGYKLTKERFWAIKLIYNNERFNKIWERSIRNKKK